MLFIIAILVALVAAAAHVGRRQRRGGEGDLHPRGELALVPDYATLSVRRGSANGTGGMGTF